MATENQGPPPGGGTRERLIEAAIEILAEDGMAGFTHRRIEDRAGTSHGSTTYHFGSIENVLDVATERILSVESAISARVMLEALGIEGSAMTTAAVPSEIDWASPRGLALTRWIAQETIVRMAAEQRTVLARYEIYLHAARHPGTAARLTQARHAIYAAQTEQARILGYPEPELYARMITALIDGLVIHHLGVPDEVIIERGADIVVSSAGALRAGTAGQVYATRDLAFPNTVE